MENLGFLLSLGAALAWGTYMVPLKISKSDNLPLFQALMGVGILISGFMISSLAGYSLDLNPFGLLSGCLWALASSIFLGAVINLGLSKAAPIVAALVIIGTFSWGVFVFGEIPGGLSWGVIGILIIIVGVVLVSTTGKSSSKNARRGFISAFVAGLIWASQIAPLKIAHLSTAVSFFSVCVGIFATGLILALIKGITWEKKEVWASFLSGTIWNFGNLVSLLAVGMIGLSKAFPISQSASLVAVLWGLFYFKEVTASRDRAQVLIGAVILLLGVIILGMA